MRVAFTVATNIVVAYRATTLDSLQLRPYDDKIVPMTSVTAVVAVAGLEQNWRREVVGATLGFSSSKLETKSRSGLPVRVPRGQCYIILCPLSESFLAGWTAKLFLNDW